MTIQHLTADQYQRVPWKNGLGVSQTIVQHPADAGFDTVLWQVGTTTIEADCPFSDLSGMDRQFMVIQGAGVELSSVDAAGGMHRAEVRPGIVHRFQGDWRTQCRLLDGPVRVLNVMTRRGRFSAQCGYITTRQLQVTKAALEALVAVELDSLQAWVASGTASETCHMEGPPAPLRLALMKILEEERK
jgi:environmental stress-induced protein Ves